MSEIKTCPHCSQKNRIPSDRVLRDAKCGSCGCLLSGPDTGLECPKCHYRFEPLARTKKETVRCPKCRKVVSDNRKFNGQQMIIIGVLVAIIFILAFIGMSSLSGSKIY
ncbi:MAG: hypothetical protein ACR2PB_08995 [Desulfocapsaceae bacterium]